MKQPPVPRQRIFDYYWYFAAERQRIFERRVAGAKAPWTSDRILREFKFCNVYRAADRVSQYLIRNVAYHEEQCTAADRAFQIVAFRTFSRVETWESVRSQLGCHPTLEHLRDGRFGAALDRTLETNGGLYTGAFILCATNAFGKSRKHLNHVELFRRMFLEDRLGERLLEAKSLETVFYLLRGFPLIGDFMAYQTAIDLNYSDLFAFSENEFTQPGPGALRGIRKVFERLGDYGPADAVRWMVDRQVDEFASRELPFNGLWGRPLHAIDCQGLFCEVDKYCREAAPELASARKRIKAKFLASSEDIILFFPPKWGLNERIPHSTAEGTFARGEVQCPLPL